MIYLDAASTAEYRNIDDIVVDTITTAMRDSWQNPSSLYAANIKEKINKCRANVAKFIGAKPNEIIFTSGASESNNTAIRGWVDKMLATTTKMVNVITIPIEHKSTLEAVNNPNLGAVVRYCNVDEYGFVDLKSLRRLLWLREKEPILVSVNMANNEIGTIQDIKKISDLVHEFDGILHVDATQAVGHIPINVEQMGIDMLSASGHKISSVLKGVGFLYKKEGVNIRPLIYGAQEFELRGGTENTFGIIGFNKALEYCDTTPDKISEMCKKRDYFIDRLVKEFGCKLNGHSKYRLPNNINVTFPQNITGESLLYTLDLEGIKIGTGSACNSKSIQSSHVLRGIGLTEEEAIRSVRFSLPNDVTYEDINDVIKEIHKAIRIIEV